MRNFRVRIYFTKLNFCKHGTEHPRSVCSGLEVVPKLASLEVTYTYARTEM